MNVLCISNYGIKNEAPKGIQTDLWLMSVGLELEVFVRDRSVEDAVGSVQMALYGG